jgi:hypothetical protein
MGGRTMTNQDVAGQFFLIWDDLRNKGIPPRHRMDDPRLQRLEAQLRAIKHEMADDMAPIKQAIERRQ